MLTFFFMSYILFLFDELIKKEKCIDMDMIQKGEYKKESMIKYELQGEKESI